MSGGVLALSSAIGVFCALPASAAAASITDPPSLSGAKVSGTPCTVTARACVDLDKQTAWLITNGKVTLGPVRIASGGQGKETPMGDFHVLSKDKDHKSNEFPLPNGQPAPMPNSVFFEPGGIAFHSGDPKRASAGCVHVSPADSLTFFNTLNVGDEVQVTRTTKNEKGGFYGVNHLDPPKAKSDDKSSADKSDADKKSDSKSSDSKKTDSKKKD
ncbi:MAG TPA: L,D-transpeptidase [Pseudonocardia sp.]|nr:L,D-transpeptidase [Pseudonocardia sp.]